MIKINANRLVFDEDAVDNSQNLEPFKGKLPEFVFEYLHDIKINLLSATDQRVLSHCEVLLDLSWEMLNTNLWVFVDVHWRYVYGYSMLYKIIILYSNEPLNSEDKFLGEMIKLCDLGLLMSGSLIEIQFQQLIKLLNCSSASKDEQVGQLNVQAKAEETFPITNDDSKLTVMFSPTIESFKTFYVDKCEPVVIDGQMSHWPAISKWSIDYIIGLAGKRTVPIEIGSKYTDEDWSQQLMTIEDFIRNYVVSENNTESSSKSKGYLAQHPLFHQIPELKEDIYVPEYCYYLSEQDDVESNVDINAWFGPAGTVSPLHFDPKHNFLCQVIGKKYVRLYHEKYSQCLYPQTGKILQNTSQIDPENLDAVKFPLAKDVPYWEGILSEGQMLYIPPKCWHYIRSLSLSFSVSFWW